ncbi:MAG: hypothetical protein L3J52_08500, partial [Proteobacteria bacterium]|nr:hypothetical protein [Pseudomonadota bacterium]
MKTFMALLKREYWEHRGAFIKAPIIIGIVFLVIIMLGYFATDKIDVTMNNSQGMSMGIESLAGLASSDIQMFIDGFMLTTASFFHFVLFIILFFFLLGSLY